MKKNQDTKAPTTTRDARTPKLTLADLPTMKLAGVHGGKVRNFTASW